MAGLVGRAALEAAGSTAIVLEARDRVGGRVLNHDLGNGDVVEMGGEWIGPAQLRVNKVVAELGLETFPTYDEGEHLLDLKGRVKRYTGEIPPLHPAALVDLGQSQFRFDRLAKRVPLEAPWAADQAERWDEETFATWVRRNTRTDERAVLLGSVLRGGVRGRAARHVAAVRARVHALGWRREQLDRRAQRRAAGSGRRRDAAHRANGSPDRSATDVRFDAPVRRIVQHADGVTVEADGVEVRARRAIVSIPPVLAGRIAYEPLLPPRRDQLTQKMPAGSVIKINVIYDEPFWRAEGLSGQAAGDRSPIRFTFDNSPPSGSPGVLVCFLEGAQARRVRAPRCVRAAACGARVAGRVLRQARGQADRHRSSRTGRPRSGPAVATARTWRPA